MRSIREELDRRSLSLSGTWRRTDPPAPASRTRRKATILADETPWPSHILLQITERRYRVPPPTILQHRTRANIRFRSNYDICGIASDRAADTGASSCASQPV